MILTRAFGKSHLYFDSTSENYSNVAAGYIARAAGQGLKTAYVDFSGKGRQISTFLENLSLSRDFVNSFEKLHIETYICQGSRIQMSNIPSVEFYTADEKVLMNNISSYEVVIVDNLDLSKVDWETIKDMMNRRSPYTEFICITKNKTDFNNFKEKFDQQIEFNSQSTRTIVGKNITMLVGEGKGKSVWAYGRILREIMSKKDVRLIYFDKGGEYYSEKVFFKAIKKAQRKDQYHYGSFDYVTTGTWRIGYDSTFRDEHQEQDYKEAREALELLSTTVNKQNLVVADEALKAYTTGLLETEDFEKVLEKVKEPLLLTGNRTPSKLINYASEVIQVSSEKSYIDREGLRPGVDM